MMLQTLPALNACLNAISALLLIAGYRAIRGGHYRRHGWLMVSAFGVSTLFLFFYLMHKMVLFRATGSYNVSTEGMEPAWLRMIYLFALLLPHLLLAMVMLPMIGVTFYFAARRNWVMHKRFARPTLIVWLIVSVTGVMIYFVLYHLLHLPGDKLPISVIPPSSSFAGSFIGPWDRV